MDNPEDIREIAERLVRGFDLLDESFVLQNYVPSDLITALRPTLGGMTISQPYRGEPYDPQHCRVIKGGWNHEHCSMCRARVDKGDEWWAGRSPAQTGLCLDCHALLERSSQAMRSAGLDVLREDRRRLARRPAATMTEEVWLSSTVPRAMLMTFKDRAKSGEFRRELRLFACACARRVWHLLEDERSRTAVEVAERYADGLASPEELDDAGQEARYSASDVYVAKGLQAADDARLASEVADRGPDGPVFGEDAGERAWMAAEAAGHVTARKVGRSGGKGWYEGGAWVAALTASMSSFEALAEPVILRAREAASDAANAALDAPLTATDPIAGAAEILAREAANQAAIEAHRYYEEPWQADLLRRIFGNPPRP